MYYTINVSLHGTHFFATSDHSITDAVKLLKVYTQLKAKFTKEEGFRIDVTRWEKLGRILDMEAMANGKDQPK